MLPLGIRVKHYFDSAMENKNFKLYLPQSLVVVQEEFFGNDHMSFLEFIG